MAEADLCSRCNARLNDGVEHELTVRTFDLTFHGEWAGVTTSIPGKPKPEHIDDWGCGLMQKEFTFCGTCAAEVLAELEKKKPA